MCLGTLVSIYFIAFTVPS